MIRLELFNPKTKRKEVFEKDYVSARNVRKALEIQEIAEDPTRKATEWYNASLSFVVHLFEDKGVTEEMILDGLKSEELLPTLTDIRQKGVLGLGKEDAAAKK
jgi:hypothetical protein